MAPNISNPDLGAAAFFQNGQYLDLRCLFFKPSTSGTGAPNQNTSRIQHASINYRHRCLTRLLPLSTHTHTHTHTHAHIHTHIYTHINCTYGVFAGHTAVVAALLAAPGIDANKTGEDHVSPLYSASQPGHTSTVRALLAVKGIAVNTQYQHGSVASQSQINLILLILPDVYIYPPPHTHTHTHTNTHTTTPFV